MCPQEAGLGPVDLSGMSLSGSGGERCIVVENFRMMKNT